MARRLADTMTRDLCRRIREDQLSYEDAFMDGMMTLFHHDTPTTTLYERLKQAYVAQLPQTGQIDDAQITLIENKVMASCVLATMKRITSQPVLLKNS